MKVRIFLNDIQWQSIEYYEKFSDEKWHRVFDYITDRFEIKNVHETKEFKHLKELIRYED